MHGPENVKLVHYPFEFQIILCISKRCVQYTRFHSLSFLCLLSILACTTKQLLW